jgi:nitrogen fixation/metabolism regulation signal transduction histidine kinase
VAGEPRLWVVGGLVLDAELAEHLSKLTGTRVELLWQGQPVATAGEAEPPYVEKLLDVSPGVQARLSLSRAGLDEAEAGVTRAFALLAALGLVASVLLGILVARRITRPVDALTEGARRIAKGDLRSKVETRASGEVGELVTAFNRMTDDLQRTTEQLVASERVAAWQEVARRLAHEIKNPLTPIKMSLETLLAAHGAKSKQFDALFKEGAHVVLEEVERLRRIVDEFSRFARLPKPQLAPLDLSELAAQVLSLYAAPPPGVEIDKELQPGLTVQADRDQLTQVLVNLIKNAEEVLASGGRIHVRVKPRGERQAVVEVEDTGPGIKPEDRGRIFEPYFTTKDGGTGLGLAIASRICQEHGGALEVGGEAGRGALFSVVLPRA